MDKESDDRGVEAKDSAPDSPRADAKDTGGDDGPGSPAKPEAGETPPTGKLLGYTQTYFIWKDKEAPSLDRDGDGKDATEDQCEHEVLFRCGNWCYTGHVVLNRDISLTDMPLVIPLLQRQQSRLHYYCNADMVPAQSNFSKPMRLVYDAADYASAALSSDPVQSELAKWAEVHDWMEDAASTFFGKRSARALAKTVFLAHDDASICPSIYGSRSAPQIACLLPTRSAPISTLSLRGALVAPNCCSLSACFPASSLCSPCGCSQKWV